MKHSARIGRLRERKEYLLRSLLPFEGEEVRKALLKFLENDRLQFHDGVALFEEASLGSLSLAATCRRLDRNGLKAYYNRNAHIEPTNLCIFRCSFCSYRRDAGEEDAWVLSWDEIANRVRVQQSEGNTEIHITGGVHPDWGLDQVCELIMRVHEAAPSLHIKAFSAVELCSIFSREGVDPSQGLSRLRDAGLGSIPGGGAEIFDATIRQTICPEKCTAEEWLSLHRAWHRMGGFSNATMLFGHIESSQHRVDHLLKLRDLQDETRGFNCFIPLKFRAFGNSLGIKGEIALNEVLRTYAISSIFLDNFPHVKAYWPMLGKENISLALAFGADDLDGTINNSTKIYSFAGASDQKPSATVDELEALIVDAGYQAVERDSFYREIAS